MKIGDRLNYCLKLRDMTQQELANKLGLTLGNIGSYVADRIKRPPADMIEDLAEGLNVNPAFIAGWSDDVEPVNKESGSLIPLYESIPSDMTREVLQSFNRYDTGLKLIRKPDTLDENTKYIAFVQNNDAMEPDYYKGDLLFIDISTPVVYSGADILVSVDYYNATVNRVDFDVDRATLFTLNDKYQNRTIDLENDNYNILGQVARVERDVKFKPQSKHDIQESFMIDDVDPEYMRYLNEQNKENDENDK